ncbi:MAG: ATP-binding protein [Desulfovibrio sp.]|jgi:anti-sigma regulatory factor (Ser/Thr protein kinase)|nr:ATP-binding protein [Desulfovibrio sp.]
MAALRLPACEESLAAFRQFALAEGARAGLAQDTLNRVELVLEEALVNVIRHAYAAAPAGCERQVELSCGADADGVFRLSLTDWGPPFDPVGGAFARPDDGSPEAELEVELEANLEADLDHREPGGMGLFLIRTMSQPAYARKDGANVLTLRFPPQADA